MKEYTYKNVPQYFDVRAWAKDVVHEIDTYVNPHGKYTDREVSVLMLSEHQSTLSLIRTLARGTNDCLKRDNEDCVSLKRLFRISNALGLDVRKYIYLVE